MKPDLHNPYGYKICYKEKGSKELVTTFIVHGYKKAKFIKEMYVKSTPVYTYLKEKKLKNRRGLSFLSLEKKSKIGFGVSVLSDKYFFKNVKKHMQICFTFRTMLCIIYVKQN